MKAYKILANVLEKRLEELEGQLKNLKGFKNAFSHHLELEAETYQEVLIWETELLIEATKSFLTDNNKVINLMKVAESDEDITKRIKALSELAELIE